MKAYDIIDALQETDDAFLEEAARLRVRLRRRSIFWLPPVLITACAALIMIAVLNRPDTMNDTAAPTAADVKDREDNEAPAEAQEAAEPVYYLVGSYVPEITELPICSYTYGEPDTAQPSDPNEIEVDAAAEERASEETVSALAEGKEQMYPLLPVDGLIAQAEKDGRKIVEINIVYSVYPLDHQVPYYQFIDDQGGFTYVKAITEANQ
ncbi:MAG: hypothetical protein IKD69_08545 [Solobacterium sp.]|nr:hypothetical protein [Solobacterium sp.]